MVSFQRMKEEIDGWGNTIASRVPVVSKTGCFTMVAIAAFLLIILGFAIGYGSSSGGSQAGSQAAPLTQQQPNYIYVSNTSGELMIYQIQGDQKWPC